MKKMIFAVTLGAIFLMVTSCTFASSADRKIDLTTGIHMNWIDRMALPAYALDLYKALKDGCDNDGKNDFLIDDSYYVWGTTDLTKFIFDNPKPATYVNSSNKCLIYVTTVSNGQEQYAATCIDAAIEAFKNDHPEVFWLRNKEPSVISLQTGGKSYIFWQLKAADADVEFREKGYDEARIKADIAKMEQSIQRILAGMPSGANDAEKVRYFNSWLIKHNQYNTDIEHAGNVLYSSLTAITGNVGAQGPACLSYSKAFKILCDRTHIPCTIASGKSDHSQNYHAWNNVRVGTDWYAIDVTNNDTVVIYVDETGKVLENHAVAESGYENEDYLLVGSDEPFLDVSANKMIIFKETHPETNTIQCIGVELTNGPVISKTGYKF